MDLASELQAIRPQVVPSLWPDHEHVRGYAVMVLPFSSGHLLSLRVWPESDFAPYVSVWHREPNGSWALYNDGPSLDVTCPRWWGPASEHSALAAIDVTWTGPNALRVEMEAPRLVWTLTLTAPPLLRMLNVMSAPLPLWTWKPASLLRMREAMAKRFLGMGDLRFAFTAPSGHDTTVMPEQMFFVESSEALWEGLDLGEPVQARGEPDDRRHPDAAPSGFHDRPSAHAHPGPRGISADAGACPGKNARSECCERLTQPMRSRLGKPPRP